MVPTALGTVNLNGDLLNGNTAATGGGIANVGTLHDLNSRINRKSASTGGGIANLDALSLVGTLVTGNVASVDGGGIANLGGTVSLTNYTVIVNKTPDNCIPLQTILGCTG